MKMQDLKDKRQEIIDYVTKLEKTCETSDCKSCLINQCIENRENGFDLIGCSYVNDLVKKTDNLQRKTGGNEAIEMTSIGFTIYNVIETIVSGLPNKKGILNALKQLRIVLGEEITDPKYDEFGNLSEIQISYPPIRCNSKKLLDLF
jgi:hypothetical protein